MAALLTTTRDPVLAAFLDEGGRTAFVWGERDCFTWVCDWIERSRGVDPAAEFRGRYNSQTSAARIIIRDFGSYIDGLRTVFAVHGIEETISAHVGDVALVTTPGGDMLAINVRRKLWACKSPDGIVVGPWHPILVAWSI